MLISWLIRCFFQCHFLCCYAIRVSKRNCVNGLMYSIRFKIFICFVFIENRVNQSTIDISIWFLNFVFFNTDQLCCHLSFLLTGPLLIVLSMIIYDDFMFAIVQQINVSEKSTNVINVRIFILLFLYSESQNKLKTKRFNTYLFPLNAEYLLQSSNSWKFEI